MIVLDRLREKIRRQMNDLCDDVATGSAQDYSEYKHMTGKIEGLAIAERLLLDVLDELDGEEV